MRLHNSVEVKLLDSWEASPCFLLKIHFLGTGSLTIPAVGCSPTHCPPPQGGGSHRGGEPASLCSCPSATRSRGRRPSGSWRCLVHPVSLSGLISPELFSGSSPGSTWKTLLHRCARTASTRCSSSVGSRYVTSSVPGWLFHTVGFSGGPCRLHQVPHQLRA